MRIGEDTGTITAEQVVVVTGKRRRRECAGSGGEEEEKIHHHQAELSAVEEANIRMDPPRKKEMWGPLAAYLESGGNG